MQPDVRVESLLVAMDPRKVMEGKATLSIGQIREAAEMLKRMRRRILRFISEDDFSGSGKDYSEDDYNDVLDLVSRGDFPGKQLLAAVPDEEIATDIGIVAKHIQQWANTQIPRDSDDSFLAPRIATPAELSVSEFMGLWRVAVDPITAVYDMEDGMLTDEEVATLSMLYPGFYGAIKQAIYDAAATVASRKGRRWEPTADKTALLRTMLQVESVDAGLVLSVQQAFASQQQEQASSGAPKQTRKGTEDASDKESTPGSEAAAG